MRAVTKNEIYRLFIRENLLTPLAVALQSSLALVFRLSILPSPQAGSTSGEPPRLAVTASTRALVPERTRHSIGGTSAASAGLKPESRQSWSSGTC